MSFWSRLMAGITAFREGSVVSGFLTGEDFQEYPERMLRYDILWAMYESTNFRRIHKWVNSYKQQYGLYKSVRNIYSPAYRLTEFWKTMIWGGLLSMEAKEEGAIPIRTTDDNLRKAIARLWKDSGWVKNKDVLTMWGAALGDVGIKIIDDVERKEMRLEVIHPSKIAGIVTDTRGFVREYTIIEDREYEGKTVTFKETATRTEGSDDIIFNTYLNDKLFAWNDEEESTWIEPYGFTPFILVNHVSIGDIFGWAEIHPERSKANEVDDLAAKLHDYIRKVVDPIWLFNFRKPSNTKDSVKTESADPTNARPEPQREEIPSLYVNNDKAKAQALVTEEIDIEMVSAAIQNVIAEMERDLPELQMDIWTVGGYTTGKALRTARQRVERKVIQRRPSYDLALVQAHQMAVAIGGMKQYEGYTDFSLDSFDAGKLDHDIPSDRDVFETDSSEISDQKVAFWTTINTIVTTQRIPVEIVLADFGWSEERITKYLTVEPQQVVDDEDLEDLESGESIVEKEDDDE